MTNYQGVLSAHIVDSYGIPGQAPIYVDIPDSVSVATLATLASDFKTDLGPLSQGVIPSVTLKVTFPGDGADPSTATGDIEKGALFNFNNATDPYAQGVLIPDLQPAILNASGLVDLTNADVITFVTFMTSVHAAITIVTKGVRALTSLKDALVAFRKHRKPLARKTKEL